MLFHLASGLQVSFYKSSIMGINVDECWLRAASESLLCKTGTLPFTYLGLPIGGNSSRICTWDPILDRMKKKLANWKGSLLSIGGRLTLLKASLSSLPLYYMSLFPIPMAVVEKITRIQRQFLWCGSMKKKHLNPIAWKTVELPKTLGGLGVGNIHNRNIALLFKWFWRLLTSPDSLWSRLVREKYGYGTTLSATALSIPNNGGPWKQICSAILKHPHASSFNMTKVRKKIGNGENTLFWHDIWVGDNPLKVVCPRLFLISPSQNASVSSCGFWDGLIWRWAFAWKRALRPRDICEQESLFQTPRPCNSISWESGLPNMVPS